MRIVAAVLLFSASLSAQELPDISTVEPDLTLPAMSEGPPAPGQRVMHTTPGWQATQVYDALYLPTDWKAGVRYPVIVEWAGNGRFRNAFGDVSTGHVEDSKLGYGMTAGEGCIWVCMPYLNSAGTANVEVWWGDPPDYDPEPTLAYCRATVAESCAKWGGDAARVVLAGFSRGALACNYLGLYDDATARLWCGFVCFSQYDGLRTAWPYPEADRASALARLKRLGGRPQFICSEAGGAGETQRYLIDAGAWDFGKFTVLGTGFRNHNDAWVLRPSDARTRLREWLRDALK